VAPVVVAAVVLAAGESRRWGRDNKLLAPVGDQSMVRRPMVRRTVEAVLQSGARPVIVATGHQPRLVRAALKGLDVSFCHAAGFAEGMSASLKAGIAAVPPDCAGVLICLGDMPFVAPATLDRLIGAYDPHAGWMALVPTYDGQRGNPVLLGRPLFAEIMRLTGDKGARPLFAAIPERVAEIPVDDPGILRDLDRPDAPAP
jgi:molybdenum cofactor cytidylyltransferase